MSIGILVLLLITMCVFFAVQWAIAEQKTYKACLRAEREERFKIHAEARLDWFLKTFKQKPQNEN